MLNIRFAIRYCQCFYCETQSPQAAPLRRLIYILTNLTLLSVVGLPPLSLKRRGAGGEVDLSAFYILAKFVNIYGVPNDIQHDRFR